MSNKPLAIRLVSKIQPQLANLDGATYQATLMNSNLLLYSLPFVLVLLLWLLLVTEIAVLRNNWLFLILVTILSSLFSRNPFSLEYEFAPGSIATTGGSLRTILTWSLLFSLGPSALWVLLVDTSMDTVLNYRRRGNVLNKWAAVCNGVMNLGFPLLWMLLTIQLYQWAGAAIPLAIRPLSSLWLPIAALLFATVGDFALAFLISTVVRSSIQSDRAGAGQGFFRQLVFTFGLSRLASPFAILAAAVYAGLGEIWYLFMMLGALAATLLAKSLSDSLRRARQRSRELATLEELGRAILAAPPDVDALRKLLPTHLQGLYPEATLIIWTEEDEQLYASGLGLEGAFQAEAAALMATDSAQHHEFIFTAMPDALSLAPLTRGLTVPIIDETGERIGGLALALHENSFEPTWYLPTVQSLAAEIAAAYSRVESYQQALANERMSQELAVAGQIQNSFLPDQVPAPAGWDIAAALVPARTTSGDFYDFIPLGEDRLGLLVADVADKGTGAALYMALSRTLIRTYALAQPENPARALALANERILQDTKSDQFVTVFYGVLQLETGGLTYCNAGHNPAYLLRGSGRSHVESLARTGIPLGIFPDMQWEQSRVNLNRGDLLLLYTDGVTEAQDLAQTLYDDERLLATSQALADQSAAAVQQGIIDSIQAFVGPAPQFDDITLLILKRLSEGRNNAQAGS